MNSRGLAIVSLVVNVILGGDLLLHHRSLPTAPSLPAAPGVAPARRLRAESPPKAEPLPAPAEQFHWSQVASADLIAYRDRLLAIGCPPRTVREILLAEINHQFEQRYVEVCAAFRSRFWEFFVTKEEFYDAAADYFDPLRDERRELISKVVGDLPQQDPAEGREEEVANRLAALHWLPPEKRQLLVNLEFETRDWLAALNEEIERLPADQQPEERRRRQAELTNRLEAAKAALLSLEELAELQLRSSDAARWADGDRWQVGFTPTEAEWRRVAEALEEFDSNPQPLPPGSLSDQQRRQLDEARKKERQKLIENTLGPERYAEFKRATDYQFRPFYNLARRLDLPEEVAISAFEIERAWREAKEALSQTGGLEQAERHRAEEALRVQARDALRTVLGDDAFEAYRRNNGRWLNDPEP